MYQYRPQNEDELELREGDRVDVMQQCDDGWFVGMWAWWGAAGRLDGGTSWSLGRIGSQPDLPHMPSGLASGEAWPWMLPLSQRFCHCPHP